VRLLLTALPLPGHVHPMVPLGLACERAGHDVRFWIPGRYAGRVPLRRHEVDRPGDVAAVRAHRDADLMALARAVLGAAADEHAAALTTRLREDPVDLVVHDATDVGTAVAAELAGVPSVAFDVGHWRPTAADRAVVEPMPASLRVLDRPDLPVVPVRPVAWNDGGDVPPRDGRPRVYLTFGTVAAGVEDLVKRVGAELAGLDVDVVDATERHVDQAAVLADSDVVVHHGGTGTMLGAVEHGRPQVVLPQGADQHVNARRLADLGAAVVDPPSVGDAVRHLLRTEAPERQAVAVLQAELLALPAPADVVPALEAIATEPRN
jgi:UDP:flavonoid glycosyltransferase YjiC (YdhE family)